MKSGLSIQPRRPGTPGAASLRFYLFHNDTRAFQEIRHGTVCGRLDGELIFPEDPLVSRRQCGFIVAGSEIYLEAFDSTNPTRVNSVPIVPGKKRRIRLNDVIEFGGQRLVLTYQNRFPPSNVEVLLRRRRLYRAIRKDDGSLTSTITGAILDKTLVLIDRAQARRLLVRRHIKPIMRPIEPIVQPVRNNPRRVLAAALVFAVACAVGFMIPMSLSIP